MRERRDLDVDGRKIWVILARSAPETPCAEKNGVLRVKDYKQSVALESDGGCGTKGNQVTSNQEVRRVLKQTLIVARRLYYNFLVCPWRHCVHCVICQSCNLMDLKTKNRCRSNIVFKYVFCTVKTCILLVWRTFLYKSLVQAIYAAKRCPAFSD